PVFLFLSHSLPNNMQRAGSAERSAKDTSTEKAPQPDRAQMERLARDNPVEFLRASLRAYDRDVKGYTVVMRKQERLGGKLQLPEVIEVAFREQPYSVYLHWLQGARLADSALYVEGQNDGMMLVRPELALARSFIVQRDPEGEEARQSGRY